MTPKEIIEILKEELDEWLKWADADDAYWTAQKYVDAYEMAINAIKKADKYRWHDLRKDPNDLPEIDPDFSPTSKRVYFSTKDDAYTGQYDHQWKTWDSDGYEGLAISEVVIAWREIEPFVTDINVGSNEVEE